MNIVDAVKSGCDFRRREWDDSMWLHVFSGTDGCDEVQFIDGMGAFMPFKYDLVADDWVVRPRVATITSTQFWDAVGDVVKQYSYPITAVEMRLVAEKLGLERPCDAVG